jgi:nucleotide sugar dehydrogenase
MEKIAVVGIGKLGLCLALNLERAGFHVLGIDIRQDYVDALNKKVFKSDEPLVEEYLHQSVNFTATTDITALQHYESKLIFITVATPSTTEGGYDHSQVERVLNQIAGLSAPSHTTHLIVGCTVMPGFCHYAAEKMSPLNYTVNYNPEFIAQGTIITNQQYPDLVLIGEANAEAGNTIEAVYRKMCRNNPTYCRMDPLSAEIAKLATNCFLTMKISFANSIGDLAQTAGADEEKILAAIGADSRIGHKYLRYGFGYGGPCFPRDNRALQLYADRFGMRLPLSAAADEINHLHLQFQVRQWMNRTSEGETVVFEEVSYKKGTSQIEESQKLKLAAALASNKRNVIIKDSPKVVEQVRSLYGNLFTYQVKA